MLKLAPLLALASWHTSAGSAFGAAVSAVGGSGPCIAPGTCTPPKTTYSLIIPGPQPGIQWEDSGGFCGAFSIQHAALAFGAWISQDLVRKANRDQDIPHNSAYGDLTGLLTPAKSSRVLPRL